MACNLDPGEVLAHLNSLGYYNITGEQLKEFMKDLKKLIKYDQVRMGRRQKVKSPVRGTRDVGCSPPHVTTAQVHAEPVETPRSCQGSTQPQSFSSSQVTEQSNCVRNPCAGCTCNCNKRASEYVEANYNESDNLPKRPSSRLGNIRKENIPPPSFIRPNIKGTNQKSDPVALFHQYQKQWNQNPLPGEDPRTDLRWRVRQKMMGPQKQPRPQCPEVDEDNGYFNNPDVNVRVYRRPGSKRAIHSDERNNTPTKPLSASSELKLNNRPPFQI